MGEPAADGIQPEPSPLDALPGLVDVARLMDDIVTVTDLHRRVAVWNAAAERQYGIPAGDALGATIDTLFDATIIGEATTAAGARTMALAAGTWRGRVAERPRVGRQVGAELVLEAVLNRLDGPDGRPVGVLSVKRDVTASVRLERELATVISLASSAGDSRTRQDAADRALEVLQTTTGAALCGITVPVDGGIGILAERGAAGALVAAVAGTRWADSPAIKAVTPVGRVVKGAVSLLPLAPDVRRALLDVPIRTLVLVGLRRDEELIGVLTLGWDRDDPVIPSDAVILLAATHLAGGIENARLVEAIVKRAESERATEARLRALDELTRVGANVPTIDAFASKSAHLITVALGAIGTAYGLLSPDGDAYATTAMDDVPPAVAEWLRTHQPDQRSAFRRWRTGEGAFLEAFEPGIVPLPLVDLARDNGIRAYAAIPIRIDGEVVGGIATYFDRAPADLPFDRGALDRVASIASIALANYRLRERLVGSERRYRTMFEASPDAIVVMTPNGVIVDANDVALGMVRAEPGWLLGRSASDVVDLDSGTVRARVARLGEGDAVTGRTTGTRRDGATFPADLEIVAVELDGRPRLLVRIRDLTDQERLQAELIQAQKMEATGQLVSGVAHELNNPLAAILGFSQLIRADPALPEDLHHNADLLVEEATRTRRIVQNLLDFARQRPPERHPTSIRALVDSVLALQSYSLGTGRIVVETDIPDDLPLVELDRGQLQQVLVNLTQNAIYAVRDGGPDGRGRIRISAALEGPADDRRVRVTVADDGAGVEPEDVEHLFEAFFTTKPPSDGTGLGLPVSYGIVASHGGELRYGPSAFGRGAAFTFDLPVHAATGADSLGRSLSTPPPAAVPVVPDADALADPVGHGNGNGAGGRVLIVDDEPAIRTFLDRAVARLGFDPVVVDDGDAAIAEARTGPFAAYLIDHRMPGTSGLDVADAIVADPAGSHGRLVLMSGDVLDPALERFTRAHDLQVLAKPFDLETLARAIRGDADDQPRG